LLHSPSLLGERGRKRERARERRGRGRGRGEGEGQEEEREREREKERERERERGRDICFRRVFVPGRAAPILTGLEPGAAWWSNCTCDSDETARIVSNPFLPPSLGSMSTAL
jgi:hypothetical protein